MGADRSDQGRERLIDASLWLLTGLFASLTLWFSLVSVPPGADLVPMQDKGLHALSYFATVLSLLFAAVWRPGRGEGPLPRALGWIVAVAIGGGIVVEVLQALIGRTPEVADVIAEALGSMLAVLVHQVIRRWGGARRPTS